MTTSCTLDENSIVDFQSLPQFSEKVVKFSDSISPLFPLEEKILQNRVTVQDANGKNYDLGAFFHGYGKGKVDGMNLNFKLKENLILDFQVTHVFRTRLSSIIEKLKTTPQNKISIEEVPYRFIDKRLKKSSLKAHKITIKELGSVYICSKQEYPNLYDRVIVHVDHENKLPDLLSYFDLEDVLKPSSEEDIERLKIAVLFRTFCPRKATEWERSDRFFSLQVSELKNEIIQQIPRMEKIFNTYLSKMEARDVLPGRKRYTIPGLAQKVYEAGGRGLVTSIGRQRENLNKLFEDAVTVWKMGLLAPAIRPNKTASLHLTYCAAGSDDSIWTQLVTERDCRKRANFSDSYFSPISFILPLSTLEMGTYQYYDAFYGMRSPFFGLNDQHTPQWDDYLNRPSIVEFTKRLQASKVKDNEVMIKEAARPTHMIFFSEKIWDQFILFLKKQEMIKGDIIYNLNPEPISIDEFKRKFVHIGAKFSEKFFETLV